MVLPFDPRPGPPAPGTPDPGPPRPAFPPGIPLPTAPPSLPPTPTVTPAWVDESFPASFSNDVRDRLLDHRRILVSGFLDDASAARTAAELMLLDGSGHDVIELHVSSDDGDVVAANALADTIDLITSPVHAWCRGSVGGPALAVFTAADRRFASAFASFLLRDPTVQSTGSAADLDGFARHHRGQIDALHRRIADATGQMTARVAADFSAGAVLDADQARRYGIVHEVTTAKARRIVPLRPDA